MRPYSCQRDSCHSRAASRVFRGGGGWWEKPERTLRKTLFGGAKAMNSRVLAGALIIAPFFNGPLRAMRVEKHLPSVSRLYSPNGPFHADLAAPHPCGERQSLADCPGCGRSQRVSPATTSAAG